MTRRPPLLAVDAGGSKIDAAMVKRDGTVVGAARLTARDHDGTGGELHLRHVVDAAEAAARDAGLDPRARPLAQLGMFALAGADLPQDDRRIARWLGAHHLTDEDVVRNDTFAVLRAGTDRTWGVAVVCGYGTNCCGVSPEGRTHRFPAVGGISGDWGGGVDIGGMALWYAIRAEDGRGEPTRLRAAIPAHFGMRRPRQVLEAMYFERLDEARVVELPPIVFRAAAEGDTVARSIVDRQADEIVTMAGTSIRKLRMTELDVHVVLGGGIFRAEDDAFFQRIRAGLMRVAPSLQIRVLTSPPLIGAALLGLDRLQAPRAAYVRARAGLTHERMTAQTHRRAKER